MANEGKTNYKAIGQRKLQQLLKSCRGHKEDVGAINETMNVEIKEAVDKHNLNKKMFGWIRQLDRMEPEKLAMHLADLKYYLDISGLEARAASAPSFDDAPREAEDDDGDDVNAEKIVPLGRRDGARPAAS